MGAGLTQHLALAGIDVAGAHDDDPRSVQVWPRAGRMYQPGVAVPAERCQNHAMDIAGRACLAGIEVAVGIEPDDADLPAGAGGAADRAERDAVVAAQHDRQRPCREPFFHAIGQRLDGRDDLRQVLEARVTRLAGLRLGNGDGVEVIYVVSERLQLLGEVGVTDGARPHVHAAAVGAEVHRDANQTDMHGYPRVFARGPGPRGVDAGRHATVPAAGRQQSITFACDACLAPRVTTLTARQSAPILGKRTVRCSGATRGYTAMDDDFEVEVTDLRTGRTLSHATISTSATPPVVPAEDAPQAEPLGTAWKPMVASSLGQRPRLAHFARRAAAPVHAYPYRAPGFRHGPVLRGQRRAVGRLALRR